MQHTTADVVLTIDQDDPQVIAFAGNDGENLWQWSIILRLNIAIRVGDRCSVVNPHRAYYLVQRRAHNAAEAAQLGEGYREEIQRRIDLLPLNDGIERFEMIAQAVTPEILRHA